MMKSVEGGKAKPKKKKREKRKTEIMMRRTRITEIIKREKYDAKNKEKRKRKTRNALKIVK